MTTVARNLIENNDLELQKYLLLQILEKKKTFIAQIEKGVQADVYDDLPIELKSDEEQSITLNEKILSQGEYFETVFSKLIVKTLFTSYKEEGNIFYTLKESLRKEFVVSSSNYDMVKLDAKLADLYNCFIVVWNTINHDKKVNELSMMNFIYQQNEINYKLARMEYDKLFRKRIVISSLNKSLEKESKAQLNGTSKVAGNSEREMNKQINVSNHILDLLTKEEFLQLIEFAIYNYPDTNQGAPYSKSQNEVVEAINKLFGLKMNRNKLLRLFEKHDISLQEYFYSS